MALAGEVGAGRSAEGVALAPILRGQAFADRHAGRVGEPERFSTRIIEISADGVHDFVGSYDEYLDRLGADHFDRAAALLRAKRDKKECKAAARAV